MEEKTKLITALSLSASVLIGSYLMFGSPSRSSKYAQAKQEYSTSDIINQEIKFKESDLVDLTNRNVPATNVVYSKNSNSIFKTANLETLSETSQYPQAQQNQNPIDSATILQEQPVQQQTIQQMPQNYPQPMQSPQMQLPSMPQQFQQPMQQMPMPQYYQQNPMIQEMVIQQPLISYTPQNYIYAPMPVRNLLRWVFTGHWFRRDDARNIHNRIYYPNCFQPPVIVNPPMIVQPQVHIQQMPRAYPMNVPHACAVPRSR
jgi:hypothetical protein